MSSWCHLVVWVLKAEMTVFAKEEAVVFRRARRLSSHGGGGAGGRAETCGALTVHLLPRLVLTRHWHDQHCTVLQCALLHWTGTNSLCYCALPWPRSRKGRWRSGSLVRHPGQPFGNLEIRNYKNFLSRSIPIQELQLQLVWDGLGGGARRSRRKEKKAGAQE